MKKISYEIPEGCFAQMEDKVRERTAPRESRPWTGVLKPAMLLAVMFVVIFGIGYGTMALTGTLRPASVLTAEASESDASFEDMSDDEFVEYINNLLTPQEIEALIADNL